MKRLLAPIILVAALLASIPEPALAYRAQINQTAADTASVLLVRPGAGWTIRVNKIVAWYDNAANTNPLYVGIQVANFPRLRALWLGTAMGSSGIATITHEGPLYLSSTGADSVSAATKGALFFISASTSDSLSAWIDYDIVPR